MTIMTLAQARENFFAAMETLRSSKVRSALTVLGIVIGVSSVISMAAIIQGLNKFVQDRVQALGSRTYFISRFPPGTDPSRWPERIRVRKYFEYNYAGFIRDAAPDVQALTTIGTRGFFFGDSNLITSGHYSVEQVMVRGAETAPGEVIQAMRPLRRIPAGKGNDFELSSPDFISNLWNQLTGALVILTTVISSIGLLVGGSGVMNIMLISVTERTQEIGVRKAIGARRADVRLQFLLEAVVLTLVGGTIGILIGAGVSTLVRVTVPSIPATLSYLWVTIGFVISVGVGLFFGYYPANLAANLDPIDCLRYE